MPTQKQIDDAVNQLLRAARYLYRAYAPRNQWEPWSDRGDQIAHRLIVQKQIFDVLDTVPSPEPDPRATMREAPASPDTLRDAGLEVR